MYPKGNLGDHRCLPTLAQMWTGGRAPSERVMGVSAEGSDEIWGCVGVKVLGPGDVIEELTIDEFLR